VAGVDVARAEHVTARYRPSGSPILRHAGVLFGGGLIEIHFAAAARSSRA